MTWTQYFIGMAEHVAKKSKDRSTKVGVVVVGPDHEIRSTGFNGFPRGCLEEVELGTLFPEANEKIEARHQRPLKYAWTEHAERNAIYHAARIGVSLKGCTMYFNYEPIPCTDCARAIIQAGITRLVGYNRPFPGKGSHWEEDGKISREMLQEAGVKIEIISEPNIEKELVECASIDG